MALIILHDLNNEEILIGTEFIAEVGKMQYTNRDGYYIALVSGSSRYTLEVKETVMEIYKLATNDSTT